MKIKLIIVFTSILFLSLAIPVDTFAWNHVEIEVKDTKTGNGWIHGCDAKLVGKDTNFLYQEVLNACDGNGHIMLPASGNPNRDGAYENEGGDPDFDLKIQITLHDPNDPGNLIIISHREIPALQRDMNYPEIVEIFTNLGPNAVAVSSFSGTEGQSDPGLLPFVFLIGAMALISGAVVLLRNRQYKAI
jgi:hypothetical protein